MSKLVVTPEQRRQIAAAAAQGASHAEIGRQVGLSAGVVETVLADPLGLTAQAVAEDRTYAVVGCRAESWQKATNSPAETVLWDGLPRGQATSRARFISTEDMDAGAVDYWPSVGGWVEVRQGGKLVAPYVGGRRLTKAQWERRQEAAK